MGGERVLYRIWLCLRSGYSRWRLCGEVAAWRAECRKASAAGRELADDIERRCNRLNRKHAKAVRIAEQSILVVREQLADERRVRGQVERDLRARLDEARTEVDRLESQLKIRELDAEALFERIKKYQALNMRDAVIASVGAARHKGGGAVGFGGGQ